MDASVAALSRLVPSGARRGELVREQGRALRWVDVGAGTPPVVLVSGAGEVGLDWTPVIPALARVVAYDRAGLGASDPAPKVTVAAQLADLVALLEKVGPAVLAGHSWGGLLAELATLTRPDLVTGLVLVDPFHEGQVSAVPFAQRAMSNLMLAALVPLRIAGVFPRMAARVGREFAERCTDDAETQALLTEAYVASYASVGQVAMIRAENRLGDRCAREVQSIRAAATVPDVPMVILTAAGGKPPALRRTAESLARQTAAAFPRGRHIEVADSGHYIHKDQPDAVVAAINVVAGLGPIRGER